ncbi:MAG: ferrous iron transport protein A [Candidatus Korarchaeota archaeon]|nr:ferrous iron transport protein A [Candidatus Korarchaeota archaeon]NIU81923.1 ferrous iron transport protein A [Candidatus Thorarchaeota archaeon]NIW12381.1 ferrous iron transport protein A [Candidatus Thorarchaeota archaeon]NIW51173.1 ferrous iron transport protein A [Candidatus Korarchaeota archaeon]
MQIRLTHLRPGEVARVIRLEGGRGFQRHLRTRGLREGKLISLLTRQPRGPLVVKVDGIQLTLGRGMARKVVVEV